MPRCQQLHHPVRTRVLNKNPPPRIGRSMLTDRLLRPTRNGDVDNVNLPWSCAIYLVVNWMVAFVVVEGIQIMCLRAGLTDNVLRAMAIFPDSNEGMLFHTAMINTREIFTQATIAPAP